MRILLILLLAIASCGAQIIITPDPDQGLISVLSNTGIRQRAELESVKPGGLYGQCLVISPTNVVSDELPVQPVRALQAHLVICKTNGRVVKTIVSDFAGQFHCALQPGEYLIRIRPFERSSFQAQAPIPVTVRTNKLTGLDIYFQQVLPSHVRVYVGQSFDVTLSANHSTGYYWELVETPNLLEWLNTDYIQIPLQTPWPVVGAPGQEVWQFKALEQGQTTITLNYVPPGQVVPLWYQQPAFVPQSTNIFVTILPRP